RKSNLEKQAVASRRRLLFVLFLEIMQKDIKRAISMLKGIGKITVPRRTRLYSSYELSLRDIDEGRVYEYKSLNDLIKENETTL
ncbi:MAG: hypothetical protein IKZ00_10505, partial [Bacteroidaceae bacterium]|nr:hypothetical protein [Bacteroidaceae bacterium]